MENGYYKVTWDFGTVVHGVPQKGEEFDYVFNNHNDGGAGEPVYVLEAKGYRFEPAVCMTKEEYDDLMMTLDNLVANCVELNAENDVLRKQLQDQEGEL
jgi:hypothetical protein